MLHLNVFCSTWMWIVRRPVRESHFSGLHGRLMFHGFQGVGVNISQSGVSHVLHLPKEGVNISIVQSWGHVLHSHQGGHVLCSPFGHVLQTLIRGDIAPTVSLHCFLLFWSSRKLVHWMAPWCVVLSRVCFTYRGCTHVYEALQLKSSDGTGRERGKNNGHVSVPSQVRFCVVTQTDPKWLKTGPGCVGYQLCRVGWGLLQIDLV